MFETARSHSELFAFQFSLLELIWNSQLIGRYKEMSPGDSYDIPPSSSLKLAELRVNSLLLNAVNESSFETVN